jgi:microcystin-dependent protein
MKVFLTAILTFAASLTVFSQTPSLMSYQGRVSDSAGNLIGATTPVNRTVTFKFYGTSTGGTPVYAEAQTVTLSGGEFSVLLGNGTGVSGFKGSGAPALTPYVTLSSIMTGNIYLGITVDDGTSAVDAEITPRQQIVSAAYAFRAKLAEGLVDGALGTSMLADTAVTTNKIGGNQVTTAKIADANIITSKIADANITTAKIADGSVTNVKLAAGAVTSDKVADGSVGNADIANSAINGAKIADGSIASIDIADGNVLTGDLGDLAVTTNKIANNSVDYNKLVAAIQQSLCPAGTILSYAGDNAPAGWFLCNGAALNRTTYSTLYSVIGTRFGTTAGDNFLLPDLRGRFLRGRDGGVGRDDDRNSRSAMNSGGATGDNVGSIQDDQVSSHTHVYADIYYSEGGGGVSVPNNRGSGDTDSDNSGYQFDRTSHATGGNETRPENANVNYIIKM